MKNFPHIAAKIYQEPWLVIPDKWFAVHKAFESHAQGQRAEISMADDDDEMPTPEIIQGIGVIPVHGIIGQHLSGIEMECGGCSLDCLEDWLDEHESSYQVNKILFDFRTPGGTVTGVSEFGARIAACEKPTVAFTDSQCCSAGYWLASQCDVVIATPSSRIGSVGVYSVYFDESKMLSEAGIEVNPISAGKYKLTGAWFKPMTADERAMLQGQVDKIYSEFKSSVLAYREISDEFLQGQVFDGADALKHGFCDELVSSMEDCLDRMR